MIQTACRAPKIEFISFRCLPEDQPCRVPGLKPLCTNAGLMLGSRCLPLRDVIGWESLA